MVSFLRCCCNLSFISPEGPNVCFYIVALPFKYWKERIDILDEANFEWKVTIIEGGHIGTKLEWAWYHVKLVPAPGGGSVYKISSQHKSLSGKVFSEVDIEADKNGMLGLYKALDAYLTANPGSV